MIAINVVALRIGLAWDAWTHERHPFAAQIPIGALLAVVGFATWYHTINALDAGRWQLADLRNWKALYVIALILCPILFFTIPSEHSFSQGRFLTVSLFNLVVNGLTLAIMIPARSFDGAARLRRLIARKWFKGALAATGLALVTLVLLLAVEGVSYLRNRAQPGGPRKVHEGGYLDPGKFTRWDKTLGTALVPDADVRSHLIIDEQTVWDVRYSNDGAGRRTTTVPEPAKVTDYAVFFGCSFLFGEGSNDDQTIPSQFAASLPKYHAYNYGVPGYGTQQMLAKLQTGTIADEIDEDTGVVIYVYLENVHEPRVIGGMQISNSFAWNYPYYDFDDDGQVRRFGNFSSGRPVLSKVYWLLGKSQFVRMMGLNFPRPHEDHYRLTAAIIEESKKLCQSQLKCKEFLVAAYPRPAAHKRLFGYLQKANIKYLDYSDLFDPDSEELSHVGDGHPTPKANRIFAQRLAADIASLEKTE